ncbi:MAG TPA: cytochrome b [Pararobbsia sp.]|jgi:cytochrome b561|nr:cytochrome b [Pararobbsia sp.]
MTARTEVLPKTASAPAPASRYTRTAMALHWLIAIGIIVNIALALISESLPDDWVRPVIDTHKSIGITVLGLAILRLLWRATHRPPPLPAEFPAWEHKSAHLVHILLYVLIFAMPLSGWMHDSAWVAAATHPMSLFNVIPFPRLGFIMNLPPALKEHLHTLFGTIHTSLAYVIYVLVGLHVAGALKHEWIDRKSVIRRMLP